MNFDHPVCNDVDPKILNFKPTGCNDFVSDCESLGSVRISFKIDLPISVNKALLLLEVTNLKTLNKHNYYVNIPSEDCACGESCFVVETHRNDYLYITIIINNLIEGDDYVLKACIDYLSLTPLPTSTPTPPTTPAPLTTPAPPTPAPPTPIPLDSTNFANLNTSIGTTNIGTNGGPSYYGTYDQNGNISEIAIGLSGNNLVSHVSLLGGNYSTTTLSNQTIYSVSNINLNNEILGTGIRLACGPNMIDDNFTTIANINNLDDLDSMFFTPYGTIENVGSVSSIYKMSKTELTVAEWAKFLNYVYSTESGDICDGLARYGDGTANIPYIYMINDGSGNKPATNITWKSIFRYCNFRSGATKSDIDGIINNETIPYLISSTTTSITGVKQNYTNPSGYFIPTIDQWYKAAYYDPTLNSNNGGYWAFATMNDNQPYSVNLNEDGNSGDYDPLAIYSIDVTDPKLERNSANWGNNAIWNGQNGNVTDVGTNGKSSPYDLYDMGGNVWEWLDEWLGVYAFYAGASWTSTTSNHLSSAQCFQIAINLATNARGMRIATTNNEYNFDINFQTINDTDQLNFDTNGYGKVDYEYQITKYTITNNEYTEFLNSVAVVNDQDSLYNTSMSTDARGGIFRTSLSGGGYGYSVKNNMGNKPANYITISNAMRFCNWLHNNKTSVINDGSYDMLLINPVRKPGAKYYLPNRDEWYKAAFYKSTTQDAGFWSYTTESNTLPSPVRSTEIGKGVAY